MRTLMLVALPLVLGCATADPRVATLEQANTELRETNDRLALLVSAGANEETDADPNAIPPPMTMTTDIPAPIPYRMKPLLGFVDHQPMFCGGSLCLRIENVRHGPMANIRVGGVPVFIQYAGGRNPIPPRGHLFIRFPVPGRYEITTEVIATIPTPHGEIPTRTVLEMCRKEFPVGFGSLPSDQFMMGAIDVMNCSAAAR